MSQCHVSSVAVWAGVDVQLERLTPGGCAVIRRLRPNGKPIGAELVVSVSDLSSARS